MMNVGKSKKLILVLFLSMNLVSLASSSEEVESDSELELEAAEEIGNSRVVPTHCLFSTAKAIQKRACVPFDPKINQNVKNVCVFKGNKWQIGEWNWKATGANKFKPGKKGRICDQGIEYMRVYDSADAKGPRIYTSAEVDRLTKRVFRSKMTPNDYAGKIGPTGTHFPSICYKGQSMLTGASIQPVGCGSVSGKKGYCELRNVDVKKGTVMPKGYWWVRYMANGNKKPQFCYGGVVLKSRESLEMPRYKEVLATGVSELAENEEVKKCGYMSAGKIKWQACQQDKCSTINDGTGCCRQIDVQVGATTVSRWYWQRASSINYRPNPSKPKTLPVNISHILGLRDTNPSVMTPAQTTQYNAIIAKTNNALHRGKFFIGCKDIIKSQTLSDNLKDEPEETTETSAPAE